MYEYWAILDRVIDGDTYVWKVDQGFDEWRYNVHLRLGGVSLREKSMPGGLEARAYLQELLPVGAVRRIRSIKLDRDPADTMSFNRYVCYVMNTDGGFLHQQLIAEQWASPWDGKTKPVPYPPWPRNIEEI